MAVRKFRRGETTYTCRICGKLTRNTGDEGSCRLCKDCFTLAGNENALSDNGDEYFLEYYGNESREILARRPELTSKFHSIAATLKIK